MGDIEDRIAALEKAQAEIWIMIAELRQAAIELAKGLDAVEAARAEIPEARIESASHAAVSEEDFKGTFGELLQEHEDSEVFSKLLHEALGRAIRRGIALARGGS